MRIGRLFDFIRRERLYLLLFIFILEVNVILLMPSPRHAKTGNAGAKAAVKSVEASALPSGQRNAPDAAALESARRAQVEKAFAENRYLAVIFSLTALLVIAVLLLGLVIDAILLGWKLAGKNIDINTYVSTVARWGLWDVAKVVILFLFFGYMLIMIESALIRIVPIFRDDNFRMILNSSILDTLGVIFILYFCAREHKEKLAALGLSLRNFAKNVFYGVVGYIALVPMLIAILAGIAIFSSIIKYVPEKQPVVELFLKEKDAAFLFYTSIFAAVFGPIIEELFFRGFMYNAFKKHIGIFWAMVITASTFAALHAHAVGFLPIMALGMLLAYLYEKTGTLVSSITVHMIHNLSMVLMVFLVKQLGVG